MAQLQPAFDTDLFRFVDAAMPVYCSAPDYRLLHGDCVLLLDRLPAQSVDLLFADPPYLLSNGGTTCHAGRRVSVDKGKWDASSGLAADHDWNLRWLAACQRVLKPSGTIWVSGTQHVVFSIGFALQSLGFHLLNTVTWFKPNASPNLACRFFTHSTELIVWAAPQKRAPLLHTFNYQDMKTENGGKQMRDLWSLGTPKPSERANGHHPTQKPLALLDRIVRASSSPGDLVLDPFNGSGTTGVAALVAGRRYLGIDINRAYLALTRRRVSAL
jgi:site-specific DNA-methyltransferase (adenine-specific)